MMEEEERARALLAWDDFTTSAEKDTQQLVDQRDDDEAR